MERFTEMSDEYDKVVKLANAHERKAQKAEARLKKVMEENARLKKRAETAETAAKDFTQLVKYLPKFADKVMDSNPVTEKFRSYAQAAKLATRCEWYDLLCKLGDLSQLLPSDMVKEICATDDAREALERAKKGVEKVSIPALEELSQREGVSIADIEALEL
ncbi:uncharacterized protein [Rutidosis leptorrhynchoides]|uniref:uncharacterized protein n=1 Tax=Rutidosis leptorrhynchoides TaxID=125765 RepID=UPI003A9932DB